MSLATTISFSICAPMFSLSRPKSLSEDLNEPDEEARCLETHPAAALTGNNPPVVSGFSF